MGIVLTPEFLQLEFRLTLEALVIIDMVVVKFVLPLLGKCTLKSHVQFQQT